jgi:hypothetical protein
MYDPRFITSLSFGETAEQITVLGPQAVNETLSDSNRVNTLAHLGLSVHNLLRLVYGYTDCGDDSVDCTDEIINWTFVDVADDLSAAIWNITSGLYKAAGSCLRNALDVAIAALYFQVNENIAPKAHGWNEEFTKWDTGQANTPNWGTTKTLIKAQPEVQMFDSMNSCNVMQTIHDYFHYLCSFTHGRPFYAASKLPTNNINMGMGIAEFNEQGFTRFCELTYDTIGWIGTAWLVTFPRIMESDPLNSQHSVTPYETLLRHTLGGRAVHYARSQLVSW